MVRAPECRAMLTRAEHRYKASSLRCNSCRLGTQLLPSWEARGTVVMVCSCGWAAAESGFAAGTEAYLGAYGTCTELTPPNGTPQGIGEATLPHAWLPVMPCCLCAQELLDELGF